MLVDLLLSLGIAVAEPMPEVPPPPPLPVKIETDVDRSSFLGRLIAAMTEPTVEPFDGRGQAERNPAALDPALRPVLQRWSEFSEPARRLRVRFQVFIYDTTFGQETRYVGEFLSENDSSRLDLRPVRNLPTGGTNSGRLDSRGQPYRVATGRADSYIVRGQSVTVVNHDQKTYTTYDQSSSWITFAQSTWIAAPFRPFPVDERTSRFSISPGGRHEPKGRAHLRLEGLDKGWREQYESVEVMLDAELGRPAAMKIVLKPTTREIVYVFDEVAHGGRYDLWSGDPFQLDRAEYTDTSIHFTPRRRKGNVK